MTRQASETGRTPPPRLHTRTPHPRLPVEDYLKKQGRFAQLFTPQRDETTLCDIQSRIDTYWQDVSGTS